MEKESIGRRMAAWLESLFPPREVIIRADGEVRYLALGSRKQKLFAGMAAAVLLWTTVITGGVLLQRYFMVQKDDQIASQQLQHLDILQEVGDYHARYSRIVRELELNQAILLEALELELGGSEAMAKIQSQLGDPGSDRDRMTLARGALSDRLADFAGDLQEVAARNDTLRQRFEAIAETLSLTRAERQDIAAAREALGRLLDQERAARVAAEIAAATSEKRYRNTLRSFEASAQAVARLESDAVEGKAALNQRDLAITTLRQAGEEFASLLLKRDQSIELLEQRYQSLSLGWELRYGALRGEKERLVARNGALSAHIEELGDRQLALVGRLEEAAKSAATKLEKTLAEAGLPLDGVLEEEAFLKTPLRGRGGPFIEGSDIDSIKKGQDQDRAVLYQTSLESTSGLSSFQHLANFAVTNKLVPEAWDDEMAVESDLSGALDSLEDELARWQSLQALMGAVPLAAPLEQFEINSFFGTRWDPVNGNKAKHLGMDFGAKRRTSVYATAPGRVIFAAWYGQFGKLVEIDHGYGIVTRYAHMNDIIVKKGDIVTSRQKIGTVGSTGRSTGPHVHYEVLFRGEAQDPAKFLTAGKNVFKE